METYKMDATVVITEYPYHQFKNDKEAWNELRLISPDSIGTLYKMVDIKVEIVNKQTWHELQKKSVKEIQEKEYDIEKEIKKPLIKKVWIPVLIGLTNDEIK